MYNDFSLQFDAVAFLPFWWGSTPKELHKWIKIMLDAYNLSKEETDMREANQMSSPIVIQRLHVLKETIENEYMEKDAKKEEDSAEEA